jgi:predicted DNA-binding protein
MRTEITPQMASMITIGATSNGNIVGSDSTALSRMNSGIIDRYKVAINDPETPQLIDSETKPLEERFKIPLENFNKFLDSLSSKDYQTKPQWNLEAIEAYSSTIQDFLTYEHAKQSEKEDKGSPTIGF